MTDYYFERKLDKARKEQEKGTTRMNFYSWEKEGMERFIQENHENICKWDFLYMYVDIYI